MIFYAVTLLLSDPKTAFCAVFCSIVHELGHYFAALMVGARVNAFILYPFGAEMKLSFLRSYKNDIIISFFGPLINIFAALIGNFLGIESFFVIYNLTLAFLNLLPIKHLDGGSILSALLLTRLYPNRAEGIVTAISFLLLVLLWGFAVYVFMMKGGSPSLFFIAVTLFASTFLNRE